MLTACLLGAIVGVASCSAKPAGAGLSADGSGQAGTLQYSGVINGSTTIQSAICSRSPGSNEALMTLAAPATDGIADAPPGAAIQIGFFEPGATINFTPNAPANTVVSTFVRGKSNQGLQWAKFGGKWTVTLSQAELYNLDILHRKTISLSGRLVCTHMVN